MPRQLAALVVEVPHDASPNSTGSSMCTSLEPRVRTDSSAKKRSTLVYPEVGAATPVAVFPGRRTLRAGLCGSSSGMAVSAMDMVPSPSGKFVASYRIGKSD